MASTAAPSAPSLSPRPIHREAARAAASVTRTSSIARFRSGTCLSGAMAAILEAGAIMSVTMQGRVAQAFDAVAAPRRRLRDDVGRPARAGLRPRRRRVPRPVPVHPRARTRRCTARSCGRCGCSPASAPPTTPTAASRRSSRSGGDGLSTAFDLPTLMGRDSDDPMREGEVGKCGVAIDTLADMEDLFAGIDLGDVTTSMTINSPAAVIFAMYVAVAEKHGRRARPARRHAAERHPEGVPRPEGVRVPAPAVDAAGARHHRVLRRRDAALAPDLDLRLPHPRGGLDGGAGAGVHARRRLRLRRAGAGRPGSTSTRSRRG